MAMGIAIPDVGGWANGMAVVKTGKMARTKACEKYISDWGTFL